MHLNIIRIEAVNSSNGLVLKLPLLHGCAQRNMTDAHSEVCILLTLGAQVICMPGTGKVVMYMVTQRYKYRVPMRKKNRLIAMDL